MNRRGFLKLLGAAAPVALAKPTYFFAPVGGWASDVIINPSEEGLLPYAVNNGSYSTWINKTPAEILADFNFTMESIGKRDFAEADKFYMSAQSKFLIERRMK